MDPMTATLITYLAAGPGAIYTSTYTGLGAMMALAIFIGTVVVFFTPVMISWEELEYRLFFKGEDNNNDGYTSEVLEGLAEYENMVAERQETDIEKARRAVKLAKHRARVRTWLQTPETAPAFQFAGPKESPKKNKPVKPKRYETVWVRSVYPEPGPKAPKRRLFYTKETLPVRVYRQHLAEQRDGYGFCNCPKKSSMDLPDESRMVLWAS